MLPSKPSVYPEFVADQVLTAHDLNESFGYLDEQGRMTRTNLIGIGIVCGLQVQINAAQTEITITKGCGVTSEGYLITVPTTSYTKVADYNNHLEEKTYDRFVNAGPPKTEKFDLWELKQASLDPDATDLTGGFLSEAGKEKIVMLFVELLEVGNKNCDPNSCDDKGKHYEVTFRPLLVNKNDALQLIGASGSTVTMDTFTGLTELRMRRFDVPNTSPVSSLDIFDAYKAVLNNTFLNETEAALSQAYSVFSVFVNNEFTTNPFAGLAAGFAFINNGTINSEQLKHIQYYYDLFSDFLQAYAEFRKTGMQIISVCCPDSNLFPRHLLLGEAIPLTGNVKSAYRHYFIYSPLFEQKNLLSALKSLFRRLVLLKEKFLIPPVSSGSGSARTDPNIRITPSKLEDVPISKKAIPYYYNPVSGTPPLYKSWDFEKTIQGVPQRNLSYNAIQYNASDDFIIHPLRYDLEPYNFLRVEGIIGKPYASVLRTIKKLISVHRLPFDVIALNTENSKMFEGIGSLSRIASFDSGDSIRNLDLMNTLCHFQDLEALYDSMKSEMLCMLCKELKYYYDLRFNFGTRTSITADTSQDQPSQAGLFNSCSPGYIVKKGTFGFLIEKVYNLVGDDGNVTTESIAEALDMENFLGADTNADGVPDNLNTGAIALLGYVVPLFEIPIYIIRLANTFTASLGTFDANEYCKLHKLLSEKANSLKFAFNMFTASDKQALRTEAGNLGNTGAGLTRDSSLTPASGSLSMLSSFALTQSNAGRILLFIFLLEDFFDHLDVLIYNCKCSAFKAIKTEYLKRVAYLTLLRQFGYFTKYHPGIQHKAGVPMGGTFIVVYHSKGRSIGSRATRGRFRITGIVLDESGAPLPGAVVQVENTARAGTTNESGQFALVANELPVTLKVLFTGLEQKQVIVESEEPLQIVMGDDDDVTVAENAIDTISEGTVIADFYLPYRCCSDCPPIQYVIRETKETIPDRKGPVVDAGPPQTITLPTNVVALTGTATTDPGGSITLFSWSKFSGPGDPEIITANSAQTSVQDLVEGVYQFDLVVTDDKGAVARDSVTITVLPAPPQNQPPVAEAGEPITITFSPTSNFVNLTGSASDPEAGLLTFLWSMTQGPNTPNIVSPGSLFTPVTGLVPGDYIFNLKVTDDKGLFANDQVKVTVVKAPNQPPKANAGNPVTITLPAPLILNGNSSSDPEGEPLTFAWRRRSGPNNPQIVNPGFAVTQVTGLVAGDYEFELKVTDPEGLSDTAAVKVTVNRAEVGVSCGPLGDITDAFTLFIQTENSNDPGRFGAFRNAYADFRNVSTYFRSIDANRVKDMTVSDQTDFFAKEFLQLRADRFLTTWLEGLNRIILSNADLNLIALKLYRILVQLAMYIACIHKTDFNTDPIPTMSVFETIFSHIRRWAAAIPQGTPQRTEVENIDRDMEAEMARITAKGEATVKARYMRMLQEITNII